MLPAGGRAHRGQPGVEPLVELVEISRRTGIGDLGCRSHRAAPSRSATPCQGSAERAHQLVDLIFGDHERRREHHQIAVDPVGMPDVGPHHQPSSSAAAVSASARRRRARERLPAFPVRHQFHAGQEPAAANVAHSG